MTAKVITSMPELLDAIRRRRDELNISHETIDALAGFPSGYTGKLLAPIPVRGVSHMSLGGVLGALAMGLVPVEDSGQRAKVEGRWQPRKRPSKREHPGALIETRSEPMLSSTKASGDDDVQTTFEFPAKS
jgi:hypothetical protein